MGLLQAIYSSFESICLHVYLSIMSIYLSTHLNNKFLLSFTAILFNSKQSYGLLSMSTLSFLRIFTRKLMFLKGLGPSITSQIFENGLLLYKLL